MNIIIKKKFLYYKGYKLKCSIGKSGTAGVKKEGDFCTPKGTFKLGTLYYRKDRTKLPKCILKKKIIKKNMGWCDDINSSKYNRQIFFPFKYRSEKLHLKKKNYDIFINILYNYNPIIKGKGSAIFLHITSKNYNPTKGCVAVIKKDLIKILPLIKKKTKIKIK
tara:strand:- start:454 stop:945 length:492 start_codon:yes stop_codon:yes gene_type:complete